MKVLLITSLAYLSISPFSFDPAPSPSAIEYMKEGAVKVSTPMSSGSGVVVRVEDGKSFILTAAHVVDGFEDVLVTSLRSRVITKRMGKVVRSSVDKDLALVVVKDTLPSVDLVDRDYIPTMGDRVFAVGCSGGAFPAFLTEGFLFGECGPGGDHYRHSSSAWYGNSGGPLYNQEFKVIGIVVQLDQDNHDGPYVSDRIMAVRHEIIWGFLGW